MLKDFDFSPCYTVDLELDYQDLKDLDVFNIASYNDMWGQELDEPLIAIKNVPLKEGTISFLGTNQKTMRIVLDGKKTTLIKFNASDELKSLANPDGGILYATIIGKCNLNHYMGNVTPQIFIEDMEITRKVQWDF
jgi:single-stranded DNA-specific DHH superfamily exonuclease